MKTAYSQYNLMKFHVLYILKDQKWWWWYKIYKALPLEPKPKPDSFQKYMRRLHGYGKYQKWIRKKRERSIESTKYLKRTYVLRKRRGKKVYYKISPSGLRILKKLEDSITLKI